MEQIKTKYISTDLAITVSCVCGSTIAANLILGGDEVDEDMTRTMAEYHLNGGKVELVNVKEKPFTLKDCTCNKLKVTKMS